MPTVAEVLKSAGMGDAEIAALDAKAVTAFGTMLTTAEQDRQKAELAQRSANEMFENQITPALNAWGNKEANLQAERDYYKAQAEGAKAGGFIADVPPFQPTQPQRGPGGQFVANANEVPGSPNFKEFENKVARAIGNLTDLQWRYQTLYGRPMPDAPTALVAEAEAQRMPLPEYIAKKYDFVGKETAIAKEAKDKEHEQIRKEAFEERDKFYAERGGSNPNVRAGQVSQYTELKKGVSEGARPDPLKMSREQRHAATAQAIRSEVAASATA